MTNVNKNVLNVTVKNVNKQTRGQRPKEPHGKIETCGRCGGWEWKIKPKSPLDNFVKERGEVLYVYIWEDIEDLHHKTDKLTISVSYTKCVKFDEIEKENAYSSTKMENIKKWATIDAIFESLPDLIRRYDLYNDNKEKFEISDGNHRIRRAKQFGMKCIKAMVIDRVKVDKTDTNNIELKKK